MNPNESMMERKDHYQDIAEMKEKIAQDTQRIEQLKREQNMKGEDPKNVSQYAGKVVDDLEILKRDYEKAGGTDPKYFLNCQNN